MKRAPARPPELPGFTFVRLLGRGGFADVFLYQQKLPKRQVAIKVLLTEALTEQSREQFASEANLMAALAHPNIVSIHHADLAEDGRPFFVMEYCPGSSLATRYKESPFSVEEALRDGVRLAGAVATAHAAGILHRDIKPANVLINSYGAPALTDFGISVVDGALTTGVGGVGSEATENTSTSTLGLSVPWSPPELLSQDAADVRSDVYSLGATVYTLLAGRSPFEVPGSRNTQKDLIARIVTGELPSLGRDDVPQALQTVLERSMALDPAVRYQKASDFARALQGVELELGFHPTPVDLPRAQIERAGIETIVEGEETRVASSVISARRSSSAMPPTRRPEAPPRRPLRKSLIIAGSVLLAAVLVVTAAILVLPQYTSELAIPEFTPAPGIAPIAGSLDLTAEGQEVLARTSPQLLPEGDYDVVCPSPVAGVGTLSCIAEGRIVLYDVKDTSFDGIEAVALARQLLHAAWDSMPSEEQDKLAPALTAARSDAGDVGDAGESIAFAVKNGREAEPAATYAVIGTQQVDVGRELEASYGRFFLERAKIVALHVRSRAVLQETAATADDLRQQIADADAALSAANETLNAAFSQLNSDIGAFNSRNDAFGFATQQEYDAAYNELTVREVSLISEGDALFQRELDITVLRSDRESVLADLDILYANINIESWTAAEDP